MTQEQIEAIGLKFMHELHSNVPEAERPMSWSDFSDEQRMRILAATYAAISTLQASGWRKVGEDEVVVSKSVVKFLNGEAALDGKWFGDIVEKDKWPLWWRRYLPQIAATEPKE